MKTQFIAAAAAVLIALPGSATAATTVFTSQAAFNTAAGATLVEDFEDTALLTGLSITTTTGSISGGLYRDSLSPGVSTTFNFVSGQSAFGGIFDLSPGGEGLGVRFTLGLVGGGTEAVTQEVGRTCVLCFFGFTSTNPFLSVTLNSGTQPGKGETFNLNDLQIAAAVAAVPEPATWAMMLFGFGAVGYSMRSRKVGYKALQTV